MSHLEMLADNYEIEDQPVYINGEPMVNATVIDGRVVVQTAVGHFNQHPPCDDHVTVQHRDGKPPWCRKCGLTSTWQNPHESQKKDPEDAVDIQLLKSQVLTAQRLVSTGLAELVRLQESIEKIKAKGD